jgi:hypothetical protein
MIIRSRKEINMEQHNPHSGGSPHEAQQPLSEDDHATLFDYISNTVETGAPIDDITAKAMALLLHDGEGSALYEFARTGSLPDVAGLHAEIAVWRQDGPVDLDTWLDAFTRYVDHREDRGPLDGWQTLWLADRPSEAEPDHRQPVAVPENAAPPLPADRVLCANLPELRTLHLDDGWGWMKNLPEGWKAHGSWGRDGWDLGSWPYRIVAIYDHPEQHTFAYATYTEGDVRAVTCESQEELYEAVDDVAEYHWRNDPNRAPDDLPAHDGLLAHHCGPFDPKQVRAEELGDK